MAERWRERKTLSSSKRNTPGRWPFERLHTCPPAGVHFISASNIAARPGRTSLRVSCWPTCARLGFRLNCRRWRTGAAMPSGELQAVAVENPCIMPAVAIHQRRVSRGTNRTAGQKVYSHTTGRAGVAYSGTSYTTAAQQVVGHRPTRDQAEAPTRGVMRPGISG